MEQGEMKILATSIPHTCSKIILETLEVQAIGQKIK
jgi:hypothetical protein